MVDQCRVTGQARGGMGICRKDYVVGANNFGPGRILATNGAIFRVHFVHGAVQYEINAQFLVDPAKFPGDLPNTALSFPL